MKIENKNQLPQSVFHWITKFNEANESERAVSILEKGLEQTFTHAISATSLLKSAQEVVLTDRHYKEITREASDIFDAIIGTAVHDSFKTMPMRENEMREIRVGTVIKDVFVHGEFDNLFNEKLSDYKTMKIGQYLFGDKEFEFTAQMSIYRYLLLADKAIEADEIGTIICLFTDWRDGEYKKKKYGWADAPKYPFRSVELNYTLWDYKTTEKWILRRITDYKIASMAKDNELPPCTDKERWLNETKKGKKTYRKCEQYCSVAPFCHQWKKDKIESNKED